jgi:16S rRNA G966 N2-methylase RsmD
MGKGAAEAAARQAKDSLYVEQERPLVAQIAEFVRRQATSMVEMAPAVARVDLE